MPAEPFPVHGAVAGIDDEQEILAGEPVEICVVDDSTRLVRDERVLRLPRIQSGGVVGQGPEQKRFGAGTRHPVASHVAHIEKPGTRGGWRGAPR